MANVVLNIKENQKEEEKFFVGEIVSYANDMYMLCLVNNENAKLISINSGNRWDDKLIKVKYGCYDKLNYISRMYMCADELKIIFGDDNFKILKNTKITIEAEV